MVQPSQETISGMASNTVKYDFEPAQPTPGDDYDKFEERLLNSAAGQSDDRGWSLAGQKGRGLPHLRGPSPSPAPMADHPVTESFLKRPRSYFYET